MIFYLLLHDGGLLNSVFSLVARLKNINIRLHHLLSYFYFYTEVMINFYALSPTSSTTKTTRSLMFVCDEVPKGLELLPWKQMDKTDELCEHKCCFQAKDSSGHVSDNSIHDIRRILASRKSRRRVRAFRECVIRGTFIFHISASRLCLLSIMADRVLY